MSFIQLIEAIGKNDATITRLDLSKQEIGDFNAAAIADALAHNSYVTSIDLRHNRIGDKGAKYLAEALIHNKTLLELHLSDNQIGEQGAFALAKAFEKNPCLKKVFLLNNPIPEAGITAFLKAIPAQHLQELMVNLPTGRFANLAAGLPRQVPAARQQNLDQGTALADTSVMPLPLKKPNEVLPEPALANRQVVSEKPNYLETQASSKHTENFKNITPLVNKLKQRIIYTWPYRKTPGKNLLALILAAGLGGLLGFYLGPVLLIGSIIGAILGIGLGAASGILFENNFPGAIKGSIPSTVLAIAVAIPLFFIFGTNPLVLIAMVIAAAAAGALVVSLAHQDFVHRINQDTHKDWQHSYQAISSKDDEQLLSKANLDMHYRGPLASTAKPLVKDPIVTPSHIVTLTS